MHLTYRNVNSAFRGIVEKLHNGTIHTVKRPSRAGNVLQVTEPITITYERPWERVLFNAARDCNPFFHLFESIWMLAGRNDVAPLAHFNSKIADIASDDGKTFNGAYGYRWRHEDLKLNCGNHIDQLQLIISRLKQNPDCRRCVLQVWNVENDLLKIDKTKDVPCNTHVYFSIRKMGNDNCRNSVTTIKYLDMTVCNRSNDLIWGRLGANAVHFSILQEYMANHIGVKVGKYHQFTNNLHAYEDRWTPEVWLNDTSPDYYVVRPDLFARPIIGDGRFDVYVNPVVGLYGQGVAGTGNQFLDGVICPAVHAFAQHKRRAYAQAKLYTEEIISHDWSLACYDWICRREQSWKAKQNANI